ncbi:MAG: hypothetical protein ABI601_18150 [bacterium]
MTMRYRLPATLVFVASLAACHWGANVKTFEPAMTPAGVRVALRVRGERADRLGELYAVDSSGVTLRAERVVRVHWASVAAMDVIELGKGYDISPDLPTIDAPHRARLAAVSRFPQGLSGALLARVLARVGQRAIEEVP